jgi:hypothetical protein
VEDAGSCGHGGVCWTGNDRSATQEADRAVMPVMVRWVQRAVKPLRTGLAGWARALGHFPHPWGAWPVNDSV